jgi:hypothetical protein
MRVEDSNERKVEREKKSSNGVPPITTQIGPEKAGRTVCLQVAILISNASAGGGRLEGELKRSLPSFCRICMCWHCTDCRCCLNLQEALSFFQSSFMRLLSKADQSMTELVSRSCFLSATLLVTTTTILDTACRVVLRIAKRNSLRTDRREATNLLSFQAPRSPRKAHPRTRQRTRNRPSAGPWWPQPPSQHTARGNTPGSSTGLGWSCTKNVERFARCPEA